MTAGRAFFFFFQAEDGIRDYKVTGVQTCALPICSRRSSWRPPLSSYRQYYPIQAQIEVLRLLGNRAVGILGPSAAPRTAEDGVRAEGKQSAARPACCG